MVFNFWEEINYFGKGERFLKKGTKFFNYKTETPKKKEESPQLNKLFKVFLKNGKSSKISGNASKRRRNTLTK